MQKHTRVILSVGIALVCCVAPALAGSTPVVPEPTTILLMGGGLGAILVVRHMRKKKK
jgi:peptidoglycan/LPS O-acetylase OafA/YrhL